ncbi:MAG: DUF4330 domain-containing protein [Candidatus Omnitrophota bacterium]
MAKIIDEKGRLFGIINVIDLAVILVILSFVPIIFIGYKVMNKPEEITGAKQVVIRTEMVSARIKFWDIEPEFSGIITKGDVERDAAGKKISEVVDIVSVNPSKTWVVVENKALAMIEHPAKKDVVIDARILCTKTDGILYHKSALVKIGSPIIFTTDLYNFPGRIVGLKTDDKN